MMIKNDKRKENIPPQTTPQAHLCIKKQGLLSDSLDTVCFAATTGLMSPSHSPFEPQHTFENRQTQPSIATTPNEPTLH